MCMPLDVVEQAGKRQYNVAMSEEAPFDSSAKTWLLIVSVLLAVYLASYGPIVYATHKASTPIAVAESLGTLMGPLYWVRDNTVLGGPMSAYEQLWMPSGAYFHGKTY